MSAKKFDMIYKLLITCNKITIRLEIKADDPTVHQHLSY